MMFPKFFNWDHSTSGALVPAMSCKDAKLAEKNFFDPAKADISEPVPQEGEYMKRAGAEIAKAILRKLDGRRPRVLIALVGKGHNGGDALIAARLILEELSKADESPRGSTTIKTLTKPATVVRLVFFANSWDDLAPLTMDAYEAFLRKVNGTPTYFVVPESVENLDKFLTGAFAEAPDGIIIDGIFGHGFRPPLQPHVLSALVKINELAGDFFRVAVDLPSGMSDQEYTHYAFKADLTCALGTAKLPIFGEKNSFFVGDIETFSLGFPLWGSEAYAVDTRKMLAKIPTARPQNCDKRTFGHLLIVGGSRNTPGALLMNVLAALRSGVGLVSVLCPESVHAAFAARAPAAMWVACKESADGGLDATDTLKKFRELLPRIDAVLCGSGMGRTTDAQCAIRGIVAETPATIPLALDADALFPATISTVRRGGNTILLPHEGEFARISEALSPADFCKKFHITGLVLKKVRTEIFCGNKHLLTSAGSPVLARGGSGDLLAGLTGSLLAQESAFLKTLSPDDDKSADALAATLAQAVCWHGAASRELEAAQGANCADISALPEFFADALRP
ncbi:MAG: NAD(P)H-hydrate dehydratase [Opitutae bacterium]|nr:NAD(P)H-hydrate dehydratase [Opitutae bacterium]